VSFRVKAAMALCSGVVALLVAGYLLGWFSVGQKPPPPTSPPDLANHSVYSKYEFEKSDSVINFGTQPLWLPGVIPEVMKRDVLLRQALASLGFKIRYYSFFKGADVNYFMKRGDLDAGLGGDMPALTACADFGVVVGSLADQSYSSIVASEHMLLRELKGKRIGYAWGSNAHYMLLQALSAVELSEKDVRLVPLDVNQMAAALNQGEIDAFSAWEPISAIALSQFSNFVVIHRGLTSGYFYFSGSFAERHQEAMRQIVASQARALAWMKHSNDNLIDACRWTVQAGRELIAQPLPLSAKQYASLIKEGFLGMLSNPIIPRSDLRQGGRLFHEFEFLVQIGKIPSTSHWSTIRSNLRRDIAVQVLREPVRYQLRKFEPLDGRAKNHEQP
jgi:NMT1-like family protein